MKTSEFDGKRVLHVDGAMNVHNGVVVGQSADGKQLYVHAGYDKPKDTSWDFAVSADMISTLIANAKK